MKIKPAYAGLAGGIVWGGAMFLATLISVFAGGYASDFLSMMASIYPGYSITVMGSLIGLVYGFIDLFIAFFLIAWLYNLFEKSGKR